MAASFANTCFIITYSIDSPLRDKQDDANSSLETLFPFDDVHALKECSWESNQDAEYVGMWYRSTMIACLGAPQ